MKIVILSMPLTTLLFYLADIKKGFYLLHELKIIIL